MDQRPHPRPPVQSALPAHIAPDLGRRHREIPLVRHDPGRWSRYAKKLVRAFGEKVFDVIEATPDRLREVDGIGPIALPAFSPPAAEPALHRSYTRQTFGRLGRTEEGSRHRGAERLGPAALVEAG